MKAFFISLVALIVFVSCAQTQIKTKIQPGNQEISTGKEAVATFGEGCFWHTEIVFQSLEGVRDAVSGYAGGNVGDPDYDKVSEGGTGHAETVNIYYDPSKISFATLVKAFFASHDPTQVNGQGNDLGSQYRSIAFYRNADERTIIESEIKMINESKKYGAKVATQVVPFTKFYPAESYHQEYVLHHPDNDYVRNVSIPDYEHFRKQFKEAKFKN